MLNDPNWDKKPVLNETSLWMLRAADYIEKYGWWDGNGCSNAYNEPDQAACMIQALALTANGACVMGSGVVRKIENFLGTGYVYLHKWNDSHSKEECIKALRDCAYAQNRG